VKAAHAAARTCIDDTDVAGALAARAAAYALTHVGDGADTRKPLHQLMQIDADHPFAMNAHGVQFEVRHEFC
jgi:hypothetical protein